MPHKFAFPKQLTPNNQRINVESCPNSLWSNKDSQLHGPPPPRLKRTLKYQSSPIITAHDTLECVNSFHKLPDYYSSNNSNSMIPQCSGPILYQSYNGINGYSYSPAPAAQQNGSNKFCFHGSDNGDCSLPSYFNPRMSTNMSHKEKVNNWIDKIQIFEIQEDLWSNNCFNIDYSRDFEEVEFDEDKKKQRDNDILNFEEILFLQSKKIDCLVRKMYDKEDENDDNGGEETEEDRKDESSIEFR